MSKQKPWKWTSSRSRKINFRSERKTYLIITEGHTEKAYLSHFKTSTKLEVIVEKPDATKQLSLVHKAIEKRKTLVDEGVFVAGQDEAWVVFDRDEDKTNPNDKKNFNAAIGLAKKEDISVALSNDSFELWYLMHFQDVSSPMTRDVITSKLSKHIGRTYKSRNRSMVEDLYAETVSMRNKAIEQAKRLHANCLKSGNKVENENPLTTVHVLLEKIMSEEGFREK